MSPERERVPIFYTEKTLTFRQLLFCRREARRRGRGTGRIEGWFRRGDGLQQRRGPHDEDDESGDEKQEDGDVDDSHEDRSGEGEDNGAGRGIGRRRTGAGTEMEVEAGGMRRDNVNVNKIKNIYYSTTEVNKVIVSSVVL